MQHFLKKTIYLLLLPLIFLSGCFNEKKEETFHTVEYYIQNKKIRESRKKECINMKRTTETISRDCKNVSIAIEKTMEGGTTSDTTGFFK